MATVNNIRPIPIFTQKDIDRFWSKVQKTDSNEKCWEWTAADKGNGYGIFGMRPRMVLLAHRISYFLHNGVDPIGMHVCHSCDNPKCCNPKHLWLGTASDNLGDMGRKGRAAKHKKAPHMVGPASVFSKLKESQIIEIRNLFKNGMSQTDIAKRYNVCSTSICLIVNGKTWRHVK